MSAKVSKAQVRHLVGKIFWQSERQPPRSAATDGDVRIDGKTLWTVLSVSGTKRRGGPGPKNYSVRFGTGDEPALQLSVPEFKREDMSDALKECYTDNLVRGIKELLDR